MSRAALRQHRAAVASPPAASGVPLSAELRSSLEPRFNHDFSAVRVHSDAEAQQFTATQRAAAATLGSDIFLSTPLEHTLESQYLLAHELSHVVQNERHPEVRPTQRRSSQADPAEGEARASALGVLGGATASVQAAPDAAIACEDPAPFHLGLLPPEMRLRLGSFGLDASTSAASLQLGSERRGFDAGYHYGGDISAGFHYDGFRAGLGVNPGSGALSLDGGYGDFNFGANADIANRSGGFHLGYGAPLLPNPDEFSATMMAGGNGLTSAVGALPGGLSDPLGYYNAQRGNIGSVASAVGAARDIATPPTQPFGIGVSGNITPEQWSIMAGLRLNF